MIAPRPAPSLAIQLMLLATACIAMTTLLAKAIGAGHLGPSLHPLQVSNGRFIFAFIAISSIALARRLRVQSPAWRAHALRTFFGWGGVSLMFAAAAFLPLSDATAISFLNPVFAMVLAIPILGEKVGPIRWGAAAIALIGALVLLRPTPEAFRPAAFLALGAALMMGAEVIAVKFLSGRERPLQILLINNGLGVVISSLAVLPFWQMPTPAQWAALAGIGLVMATAQYCYINAVARAEASFVIPFSYATLLFAALYDALIFGVLPDAVSWTGAAIIVAGGIALAWREAVLRRRGVPVA
ncbi:membrane protein [Oceanicola sp. 22II-s10i]|uniref:DMT family transporter n=1 Tax=Oceanicola sp. 22II-s10i TaxID=1317116 RepID=UPI000B520A69|nr:DMT family transporter [Oceanicola sp. 22II-s10i]OWU85488.1 membrane protein [Oceanicola sp. 22II-s10i]